MHYWPVAVVVDENSKAYTMFTYDSFLNEEEALCSSLEKVIPKDGKQVKVSFECKVENIEKPKECIGLEVVSSKDFNNIPTEQELRNPATVDELIKEKEIDDYKTECYSNI